MYQQLQMKHSLFVIQQSDLEKFKAEATLLKLQQDFDIPRAHHTLDNWCIAFNIWCLLQEKKHFLFDSQKTMMYSSNYYCLELLRTNTQLQHFSKEDFPFKTYILSYFLTKELTIWVYNLLLDHQEGSSIIEKNMQRDYFSIADNPSVQYDINHSIYEEQKLVISLMAQNKLSAPNFDEHITKAIHQTVQFYTKKSSTL